MTIVYKKAVAGRYFCVKKDFSGNWSIYSADENFDRIVGCPPFSVGHRTKKQAMDFLDTFAD